MGMDIGAYSNIRIIKADLDEEGFLGYPPTVNGEPWNVIQIHSGEYFPNKSMNIIKGACYEYDDKFEFRAGSFSGYSIWLNILDELYCKPNPDHPFIELIKDGYSPDMPLDYNVYEKLSLDFDKYYDHVKNRQSTNVYWPQFIDLYEEMHKAFKLASNNGVVVFR
jgi:hypothetical protein